MCLCVIKCSEGGRGAGPEVTNARPPGQEGCGKVVVRTWECVELTLVRRLFSVTYLKKKKTSRAIHSCFIDYYISNTCGHCRILTFITLEVRIKYFHG